MKAHTVVGRGEKSLLSDSCEIKDSVEAHLGKLCVILRSRVLPGVYVLMNDIYSNRPATPLNTSVPNQQATSRRLTITIADDQRPNG